MTYAQAKKAQIELENLVELATDKLRSMHDNGTQEYRKARDQYNVATATLITFNKAFERAYMDEIVAEYRDMRQHSRRAA